jgi:hypothetical protein
MHHPADRLIPIGSNGVAPVRHPVIFQVIYPGG